MENKELYEKMKSLMEGYGKRTDSQIQTVISNQNIIKLNIENIKDRISNVEDRLANLEVKVSEIHLRTCELENA